MIPLDATNLAILGHLRDGRKAFGEIARSIGVSENTVRTRVSRLQESGILTFSGLIDPDGVEGVKVIYVGVKLSSMDLGAKAEALSRLSGVVSTAVVTGRYDVIITALLTEKFGLLQFLTEELARVEGIASVETFVVYRAFNLRVPMIWGDACES